MRYFEACIKCVPPKRYPGCQDHCPEHAKEKAIYEKDKAAERKRREIGASIYAQKSEAVTRALKKHGRKR